MRSFRLLSIVLVASLVVSVAAIDGPPALAQSVEDTEEDATDAKERADVASGLVDEAVADRDQIEALLAETIARVNELSAHLSIVGAELDRTAAQVGFADVEMASIEADIEVQAVDAYMKVLSSPTVTLVNSKSVEDALVTRSVVEDIVAQGRSTIDALLIRRQSLENLQNSFLEQQAEYQAVQAELDSEVEALAGLYDQADAAVAEAVRAAQTADAEYRAALNAVEAAQSREAERRRQELRAATTTTTTTSPNSPPPTSGGGGSWTHPPAVERWRSLVESFFPPNRVEQALRIINCESNGDPDAYNPYSGASGLFQFIPSTWATTAHRAGYPGASPFEPEANTASAAWLTNRYAELGYYYWMAWNCKRVLN